jgi:phenylacetate-coenzyme A ligase PaaK-like adenylate-forming protein
MENRLMSAALMDVRFSEMEDRVVPFPLSGQASTIRRCARELENVHGDEALQYWKTECRILAEGLKKLGCSEDAIRMQVMAFQTEVQVEMMRRYSDRLAAEAHSGYGLNP